MGELLLEHSEADIADESVRGTLDQFAEKLQRTIDEGRALEDRFSFYHDAISLCEEIREFSEREPTTAQLVTPYLVDILQRERGRFYATASDRIFVEPHSEDLQHKITEILSNCVSPQFVSTYRQSTFSFDSLVGIVTAVLMDGSRYDLRRNGIVILSELAWAAPDEVAATVSDDSTELGIFEIVASARGDLHEDPSLVESASRLVVILETRGYSVATRVDDTVVARLIDVAADDDDRIYPFVPVLSVIFDMSPRQLYPHDLSAAHGRNSSNASLNSVTHLWKRLAAAIWSRELNDHLKIARSLGGVVALVPDAGPDSEWVDELAAVVRQPGPLPREYVEQALGGTVAMLPLTSLDEAPVDRPPKMCELPLEHERYEAATALGETLALVPDVGPDEEWAVRLSKAVRQRTGKSRQSAARALGEAVDSVPDARSGGDLVDGLIERVQYREGVVQDSAAAALGEVTAVMPELSSNKRWLTPLIEVVQQCDGPDRNNAAHILGETVAVAPDTEPDGEWLEKMASFAQHCLDSRHDSGIRVLGAVVATVQSLGPDEPWAESLTKMIQNREGDFVRSVETFGRAIALALDATPENKWRAAIAKAVRQRDRSFDDDATLTLGEIIALEQNIESYGAWIKPLSETARRRNGSKRAKPARVIGEVVTSVPPSDSGKKQLERLAEIVRQQGGIARYHAARALGEAVISSTSVGAYGEWTAAVAESACQRDGFTRDILLRSLGETTAWALDAESQDSWVTMLAVTVRQHEGLRQRDVAQTVGEAVANLPNAGPDNEWTTALIQTVRNSDGQLHTSAALALGETVAVAVNTDSEEPPEERICGLLQRFDGSTRDGVARAIGMSASMTSAFGSDTVATRVLSERVRHAVTEHVQQDVAEVLGHAVTKTPTGYLTELGTSILTTKSFSASSQRSLRQLVSTGQWSADEFLRLLADAADSKEKFDIEPFLRATEAGRRTALEAIALIMNEDEQSVPDQLRPQLRSFLAEGTGQQTASRLLAIELLAGTEDVAQFLNH